jgi:hypothetical protein
MVMVFDPTTHQLIVFGGTYNNPWPNIDLNDVWSLGLGASPQWNLLSPAGAPPAPRTLAAGVYDQANSRLTIFGGGLGSTSPCTNDTWVLSNANGVSGVPTWTQLATVGGPPSPRFSVAGYDPASNTMIIFGGSDCFYGSNYTDVWTLSSANGLGGTPTWTQLSPSGTPPSCGVVPTAVYDPESNTLIIFGGTGPYSTSPPCNGVWTLSNANGLTGTPTWTQLSPSGPLPAARNNHSAVYNPAANVMTIFGGWDGTEDLGDLWTLSNANGLGGTPTWTQLSPSGTPPPARAGHAAVLDTTTSSMIIFGGCCGPDGYFDDVWALASLPMVNLSASSLSFGNQQVGSSSATQTVTLTNTGTVTLSIASISLNGSFFALDTTPTSCPYTGGTVAAGANCTIDVTFTPVDRAGLGPQTGSISITDNAASSPQSVSLSGTGIDTIPPTISILANPSTLWPPNGKSVPVTVLGAITDSGSGVNPSTLGCNVVDSYGLVQPACSMGTLGAGGSYSFTVLVVASRNGGDKNGRTYTITVSARDYAGNPASAAATVLVPHDQGN